MLPDRVSNPGSLTYESGALPIALRGPAIVHVVVVRTLKLKKGLFFEFNAPTIRKDEFSIL